MSFEIVAIPNFIRELKRLAKKYSSLPKDLGNLGDSLSSNPFQGDKIGSNCYKIRLAISSKGKGKSGGARIITFVTVKDSKIYLLSIFDKSEKESLSDTELSQLLQEIQ